MARRPRSSRTRPSPLGLDLRSLAHRGPKTVIRRAQSAPAREPRYPTEMTAAMRSLVRGPYRPHAARAWWGAWSKSRRAPGRTHHHGATRWFGEQAPEALTDEGRFTVFTSAGQVASPIGESRGRSAGAWLGLTVEENPSFLNPGGLAEPAWPEPRRRAETRAPSARS